MSNWPLTPAPSPWPYRWRGTKWKWTFSPTTLVSYICISYLVMPSFCHFYHIQRICPSHNYWKKIKVVFFFRHCCHISANGDDQNDVSWSYIYILEVDFSVFDCLNYYMLNKTDWYASSVMFSVWHLTTWNLRISIWSALTFKSALKVGQLVPYLCQSWRTPSFRRQIVIGQQD